MTIVASWQHHWMDWVTLAMPIVGVVVGSVLQFALSRSRDSAMRVQKARHEAYAEYLNAVAKSAILRDTESRREARLEATRAKTRIVVYGDESVVERLAEWTRRGKRLDNSESIEAFLGLVSAMREGSGLSHEIIATALFGPEERTP
ncbi:MAG TPA: hypothetical protein RMH85_25545 [Polyangiaceae bacterium LLY-WYZ-15_(1-7)]|nr:hypothetical protein [Myxococcales bacterium]MAT25773.1 hypothetical protein [Sandaracinus sp.]HJK91704.1 hypothetical protein [Polyangiaceae bacterium LLY-WYZ-15_(1-7)]MBJ70745.1 hypothetical protein [Sandaracinus sp.]HJL04357.1 hypothetical protein [Polyangiaceae bacterium LLY-WYZ-15_(1-7)]